MSDIEYSVITSDVIKSFDCIRIEMQIFSLHWMMQDISFLMSLKSPSSGFSETLKS